MSLLLPLIGFISFKLNLRGSNSMRLLEIILSTSSEIVKPLKTLQIQLKVM